jgi:hypothetical protein
MHGRQFHSPEIKRIPDFQPLGTGTTGYTMGRERLRDRMQLQHLSGVLLLAAVPMALYTLQTASIVWLSLLNVVIVVASLYYMFGPAEGGHAHAA